MMKKKLIAYSVAMVLFGAVSLSQGQTVRTWTGAVDGNWSNTANWAGGTLPQATGGEGSLNNYQELVDISSGMNPTSNIPLLNGGGTQPFLRVGTGMSVAYTLSAGYDGLNQVRPESMGGNPDAIIVGANGSLTVYPKDGGDTITMSRQQNTDVLGTFFVYRVEAGGIMDLATTRVDFSFSHTRLSHLILDGGTFQTTGSSQFYGTRSGTTFSSNVYSKVTLLNGGTFNLPTADLRNVLKNGEKTMIFDIQDEASTVTFKTGQAFANVAAVEAAFGGTFQSTTFGDTSLQAADNGDGTVTVSVVDPSSATPFEKWLSGYTLGAFTNQLDDAENGGIGDGFNNLMEYALGGDPSVDDAASIMPVSAVDGAVLNYVYTRQNPMDTNLTYIVLDGTDLVSGLAGTNSSETVSGVVDGFETVTNQVSTAVEGRQFMQLKVELSD